PIAAARTDSATSILCSTGGFRHGLPHESPRPCRRWPSAPPSTAASAAISGGSTSEATNTMSGMPRIPRTPTSRRQPAGSSTRPRKSENAFSDRVGTERGTFMNLSTMSRPADAAELKRRRRSMSDFWTASTAWIPRAVPGDTANVKRWFVVDSQATIDGRATRLLCRVLGWDESNPPGWVSDSTEGRVTVRVEERDRGDPLEFVLHCVEKRQGGSLPTSEPRKVEGPVSDWSQLVSTDMWSLRVPAIMYELWPSTPLYEAARERWKQLTEAERRVSGVHHQGR